MQASVSLLGHYELENNEVHLEVNKSCRASDPLMLKYCQKMKTENIGSMTIEFDDESFIFLNEENGKIRFIEGQVRDYAKLVNRVKSGLEGEYVPTSPDLTNNTQPLKPTASTEVAVEVDDSFIEIDDSTRIHDSLGQPISQFQIAYDNAEIFFKPFEAPGGDFYWTRDYQYKNLVVVGDCTGHGMQGALIGMSVMTLLKHYFKLPPTNLADALTDFHKQMHELMEHEELSVFDAELGFIYLDKRNNELMYSGSGINMIYKSQDGECTNYRTSKRLLIKGEVQLHTVEAKTGDQIFIYSDGITDQFDNANERKLGTKGLMNMVRDLPHGASIKDFNEKFQYFSGSTEALDDQTMLVLTL
ncbi:MAG: hypothetical protein CMB80_24015 [Flammeovirgaceae bacterium]|nr:hypothetical protein [Flammeovirgaceae bacterium]MBE62052.1 hypothetical protein [Flammeovirgaceae bacterium]HCX21744.1 hypothetical protein [Cytophagales bacterium]|tara:strand:- start:3124 stop:4200 length:1077 start_codon:yes stop_codon:yes gene_type:complete